MADIEAEETDPNWLKKLVLKFLEGRRTFDEEEQRVTSSTPRR